MSPFPLLFFLFVEVPSMGVMLVHKGIMQATGNNSRPLNVWLYRLIGVTAGFLVLSLSFVIGMDAACGLLVLFIVGGLIMLATRRSSGGTASAPARRIGPDSLPGVLAELSRGSLGDLARVHGRPNSPAEVDLHLRSADLMAALRFYQVAIDPRWIDRDIGGQLAADAPGLLTRVADSYRHLAPSRERDVAIAILGAGPPPVCATMAGVALRA
jgi:hypothetical protein